MHIISIFEPLYVISVKYRYHFLMMDPMSSETCWSNFCYNWVRWLVNICDYHSHLQGARKPMKMGQINCTEPSQRNHYCSLYGSPEEGSSPVHCSPTSLVHFYGPCELPIYTMYNYMRCIVLGSAVLLHQSLRILVPDPTLFLE